MSQRQMAKVELSDPRHYARGGEEQRTALLQNLGLGREAAYWAPA
jgi:hypothetical protein